MTPVEQDHPRVERHEHKTMDSNQPLPKFNSNLLNKTVQVLHRSLDEDKRSATSDRSAKGLSPGLFFETAVSKSADEIGESVKTGDYPKPVFFTGPYVGPRTTLVSTFF